ncbi:MAG: hypothetical protein UW79_C0018G0013 [Candidatus Yanofskybacteria bacterium GW2011_GWA2_44_9]|uniref:DoxX family protein n=1 Tax=Candidatus Yanofskybacteria bacterium GW2011_GWA2_44_9 TaxID=1619025 RepID=A0A0G1NBF3_9BACT|nr:MAG: hypothetical protein UW79_C0018G0013 [Candidatus Yanofskybacteria bacterium GW2011_GWA2_44_9]
MRTLIEKIDNYAINLFRRTEVPLSRIAIFVVYFWFGFLKIIGVSPAGPMVQTLFERTLNFMPFEAFYAGFSFFEIIIGILFLIRGMERLALGLIYIHLITTVLPLFLLPHLTWQGFMVPTLEGQYIIKNILIVAATAVIGSRLKPRGESLPANN